MRINPDTRAAASAEDAHVVALLSAVDRYLLVWIGAAMAAGCWAARRPAWTLPLDAVKIGQPPCRSPRGLLLMMYPVLAKVRYREIGLVYRRQPDDHHRSLLNWVIGPR